MFRSYLCLPFFLLAAGTSPAVAQIPVQRVGAPPFSEAPSDVVKTAGGEVLGLVYGDLHAPAAGANLVVAGLQPSDRTVCVTIRHVNGAYSASFVVARSTGGSTLRFLLPANRIGSLRASRADLAILAQSSTGLTCGRSDPILPASWGDTAPATLAYALINDHQALRTQVVAPGRPPTRCTRLVGSALTAYQMTCPVDLTGSCGLASLSLQFVDGTRLTPLRAAFRRPC